MNIQTGLTSHVRRPAPDLPVLAKSGLERRRLQCYIALLLGDVAVLMGAFVLAGWLYLGSQGLQMGLILGQLVIPVFQTVALYNHSYSLMSLRDYGFGAKRGLIALVISSAVVVFIAFYTKSSLDFSRFTFTLGVVLAALFLPWMRAQMRSFVTWRCGAQIMNELIIDDGGPAIELPGTRRIDARFYQLVPDPTDPHALDRIGVPARL